jgi:hypothetical protein
MASITRAHCAKLLLGTYCTDALAYLDPGTGSILIQGAIAAIAAGAFTARIYWYKVKSLFVGNKAESSASCDERPAASDEGEAGQK